MYTRIVFILIACVVTFCEAFAQDWVTISLGEISKRSSVSMNDDSHNTVVNKELQSINALPRIARVRKSTREDFRFKDVTLSQPGTLESVLGEDINGLDSLVVRGKVNDADIYTMWKSSFHGGVTVLNLEYAEIQDNRLPKDAFWHQSEQHTIGDNYFYPTPLRRIILPEGLVEIGEFAFCNAVRLKTVNFPSSLRKFKRRCFSDCIALNVDQIIIPEGTEEIGDVTFINCKSLTAKVVLPSTIKRIGTCAFSEAKITECNFPEGLQEVGDGAFYACRLKEAILPNSCQSFPGDSHFALNITLERARIPEGLKIIPLGFLDGCEKMYECLMPNSVELIGACAFWQCGSLKELTLSSNLKIIEREGLYYCKGINSISFPSTLKSLGGESCLYWKNVKEIYCAAQTPPLCYNSTINPGSCPFGQYGSTFANRTRQDIPVYVPIGSAEAYRNAWGWDYFTNFIEMDFSGVNEIFNSEDITSDAVYDVLGRKVSNPIPGHLYIKQGKKFIPQ